jgi:hypothetical protein
VGTNPVSARRSRLPLAAILSACLAAAAGCGQPHGSRDVAAFVRQGSTPTERAILRSIGVYRTTKDTRLACSLITPHFLKTRYDGQERGCEAIVGEAVRTLPRSAHVESVRDSAADVRIRELTATQSIYRMRLEGGVWKIDDIVAPKR